MPFYHFQNAVNAQGTYLNKGRGKGKGSKVHEHAKGTEILTGEWGFARGISHPHKLAKASHASRADATVLDRSMLIKSSTHCQNKTRKNTEHTQVHQSGYREKFRGADMPPNN